MNDIPVYTVCKASSVVRALLGQKPRIHEFGQAPEKTQMPYVTWQFITGYPELNLSDRPEFDYCSVQIDIFAETGESLKAVKSALLDAIEPVTNITAWNGEGRDKATTNYRCTFTADWYVKR